MRGNLASHVGALAHPRYHHSGRDGNQQRRDLCHECVTYGQQHVAVGCLGGRQIVLRHADDESADDVDKQNQQARHGIAAHVFAGTIHRAEELGFIAHFRAPTLGFFVVDQPGVQVCVNRHLLAGHGVQGKAGANFSDPLRTLGHDDEVDHHQNREHDQTHGEIAADQEVPERFDDMPGRAAPRVTLQQHHASRGHVQREPQQCGEQNDRGEGGEIKRAHHVGGHHHHHECHGDVEGEQQVERERRQRQDHHRQNHHHDQRCHHGAHRSGIAAQHLLQGRQQGVHSGCSSGSPLAFEFGLA